jgi:hypothetical protein
MKEESLEKLFNWIGFIAAVSAWTVFFMVTFSLISSLV